MRLINRKPGFVAGIALMIIPFILVLLFYSWGSSVRRADNPQDKLLPPISEIVATAQRVTTEPSKRTGEIVFWKDTFSSLQRLGIAVAIAAALGLVFGLGIGLLPYLSSTFGGFVSAISMIPPLSILPILFITLGIGEVSKIALIIIGIAPFLIRDLSQRVREIPSEQIVKAQTLGASSLIVAIQVALPQIMPRLIQGVRLSLGPAWLFLIASEAIAAESGLGYRIFLVRRYLAMDVILTYVVWITLLAILFDLTLRWISARAFPWAEPQS
jgi:NitT/TauT family transport system permease protein